MAELKLGIYNYQNNHIQRDKTVQFQNQYCEKLQSCSSVGLTNISLNISVGILCLEDNVSQNRHFILHILILIYCSHIFKQSASALFVQCSIWQKCVFPILKQSNYFKMLFLILYSAVESTFTFIVLKMQNNFFKYKKLNVVMQSFVRHSTNK